VIGRTECLWLETPSALYPEISSALREIFTQSICNRPVGRGMSFIPTAYAADPIYAQTREWHHRYWHNAERYSCNTHYDPYDSFFVNGKSITLRAFALSLTDADGRPLYATLDRIPGKQPLKGRGSRLYTHVSQGKFHNLKFELDYAKTFAVEDQQLHGPSGTDIHPSSERTIRINCFSMDPAYARTLSKRRSCVRHPSTHFIPYFATPTAPVHSNRPSTHCIIHTPPLNTQPSPLPAPLPLSATTGSGDACRARTMPKNEYHLPLSSLFPPRHGCSNAPSPSHYHR
jgi:hypothetical protein